MLFSYDMVSEDTQHIYDRMLNADKERFVAWRGQGNRPGLSFDKAFRAWWISSARHNFKTPEDALRYKEALKAHAQG